jgi:hypothetical protein
MSTTWRPIIIAGEIGREFRRLFDALEGERIEQRWKVHYAEPDKVFPTQTLYADGTVWNPDGVSGEGLYRRNLANTDWEFLG